MPTYSFELSCPNGHSFGKIQTVQADSKIDAAEIITSGEDLGFGTRCRIPGCGFNYWLVTDSLVERSSEGLQS